MLVTNAFRQRGLFAPGQQAMKFEILQMVTNAFRQRGLFAPRIRAQHLSQVALSPMPFGNEGSSPITITKE